MAKPSAATKQKRPRTMSDEHKAALAEGRDQGRVVRRYLEALESQRPKRGRKRTPESIERRLAVVDERLTSADPLSRLLLVQERMDLQREVTTAGAGTDDVSDLQAAFIDVARTYGERKGLTYDAWRSVGVEPRVLKAAGIGRVS